MLFHLDRAERLTGIADRLRAADTATADLVSAVANEASVGRAHHSERLIAKIDKLIDASAWTDAAMALLERELPRWKLRRLAHDEGEWHCALSLHREMPEWLDEAVETSHSNLPLAVLEGLVEAMRRDAVASGDARTPTGPRMRRKLPEAAGHDLICCDNFA